MNQRRMDCMKYQVIYDSRTGNTQKLAEHIYKCLEGEERDIKTASEFDGTDDADLYFVGFCTNRNSCSMDIADVLEMLEGKRLRFLVLAVWEIHRSIIRKSVKMWMFGCRRNMKIKDFSCVRAE